jgi:hypothetical protein
MIADDPPACPLLPGSLTQSEHPQKQGLALPRTHKIQKVSGVTWQTCQAVQAGQSVQLVNVLCGVRVVVGESLVLAAAEDDGPGYAACNDARVARASLHRPLKTRPRDWVRS